MLKDRNESVKKYDSHITQHLPTQDSHTNLCVFEMWSDADLLLRANDLSEKPLLPSLIGLLAQTSCLRTHSSQVCITLHSSTSRCVWVSVPCSSAAKFASYSLSLSLLIYWSSPAAFPFSCWSTIARMSQNCSKHRQHLPSRDGTGAKTIACERSPAVSECENTCSGGKRLNWSPESQLLPPICVSDFHYSSPYRRLTSLSLFSSTGYWM